MKYTLFSSFVAAFLLLSCKIVNVSTLSSPTIDYTAFKSYSFYGWVAVENSILTDSDKSSIEQAFVKEFERKGISHKDFGGDLILSVYAVSNAEHAIEHYKKRYGPDYQYDFWLGWTKGSGATTFKTKEYEVGTLVCDVFRASDKQIIWQAARADAIIQDPLQREERIKISVSEMMEKYPIEVQK